MSSPAPIATGTLGKTPLPQLFAYLEQKKLSGTLAIWPDPVDGGEPQGQDRILLLKGVPVAGRLLEPTTVLRPGLLKLFAREQAPYAFCESNLLGDDRVSGRVDTLSLINEAARAHVPAAVIAQLVDRLAVERVCLATLEAYRECEENDGGEGGVDEGQLPPFVVDSGQGDAGTRD